MTLELRGYVDSFEKNTKGLLTTQIKIKDILLHYELNKSVNRDINNHRIPAITKYIEAFENEIGVYLPSMIFVATGSEPQANIKNNSFLFKGNFKFVVLDGQHRIKALEKFVDMKTNRKKVDQILNSTITAQIYFNLNEREQKKLFLDINSTSKKISQNLVFKFDKRDMMNVIIKDLLDLEGAGLKDVLKITEKTRVSRPTNTEWMSLVRLNRYLSYLLFNTNKISNKNNQILKDNYFEIIEFLEQYFQLLVEVFPLDFGNVKQYILGHEAMQNALAIATHEKIIQNNNSKISFSENWKEIVESLYLINWSSTNSVLSEQLVEGVSYRKFRDNKHSEMLSIFRVEWNQLLQDLAAGVY